MSRARFTVRHRIRVVRDDGTIVLGPGKADLLDAIARKGSIRAAASELGMSYMRAWTLIRTMNAAFRSPLVEKIRRGSEKGGARLTARGVAGFIALPGVAWLAIAVDGRWSAGRVAVQTVALGVILLIGAVTRAWSEFDHSNVLSYLYVAGLAGTLVGLVALYAIEERAVARAHRQ